jgi:hypothetical protein
VPIGRVIGTGWENVLLEEIEREVQSLDRKSVEDRAKYFRKTLNIDWFGGTIVPLLRKVILERNTVLHDDPDRQVDGMVVDLAHMVCVAIPWVSVAQAAVLYPGGFEMIEGLSEEQVRRVFLKGTDSS